MAIKLEGGYNKRCGPTRFQIFTRWVFGLSKKDKQSVYDAAKELTKLGCYWSWKRHQISGCVAYYSGFAVKRFNLSYGGATAGMIGYIEHLEAEIEKAKCSCGPTKQ